MNLSNEELLEEYDKASIFLFPSLAEGFGLPIVEAQSRGCIVITSNIEPMRSVLGKDGGVLVNPYDINEIAKGIITAQESERKGIWLAAGLANSKKYTSEKYIKKHLLLYYCKD